MLRKCNIISYLEISTFKFREYWKDKIFNFDSGVLILPRKVKRIRY